MNSKHWPIRMEAFPAGFVGPSATPPEGWVTTVWPGDWPDPVTADRLLSVFSHGAGTIEVSETESDRRWSLPPGEVFAFIAGRLPSGAFLVTGGPDRGLAFLPFREYWVSVTARSEDERLRSPRSRLDIFQEALAHSTRCDTFDEGDIVFALNLWMRDVQSAE